MGLVCTGVCWEIENMETRKMSKKADGLVGVEMEEEKMPESLGNGTRKENTRQ